MISPGKAIRGDQKTESEIVFWGEWEADSEVVAHFQNQADGGPEYLWRPFYGIPDSYSRLQNTDPFVFGSFLYGICQQYRSTGPTQLRYLAQGSVILFGSYLNDQFALDTVFVVKDWIDHTRSNYRQVLAGRVPDRYIDVTIKPLYESGRKERDACAPDAYRSWRLYRGATAEDQTDGMFSFFPCLPASNSRSGFSRPAICEDRIITRSSRQGFRLNPQGSTCDCRLLWQMVVDQTFRSGLWLGVRANLPELALH